LSQVADQALLSNPNSAEGAALDWIVTKDPMLLCSDSPNLQQRFILAAFYYSTQGESWTQCSDNKDLPCNASPFGGDVSYGQERWLSDFNECTWFGVRCNMRNSINEGYITGIWLGKSLTGVVSVEFNTQFTRRINPYNNLDLVNYNREQQSPGLYSRAYLVSYKHN